MNNKRTLSRRELSVQAALLLLGGATITLSGCGGGGSTTPSGDRSATIVGNHGHEAIITSAQLLAGGALSLNIQALATHNHTLDLTAAQVVQVRDGATVTLTSAVGSGHSHTITFN